MEEIKRVAKAMADEFGAEVSEELIIKLPDDGTPGHMGVGHWNVFAARCGEFVLVAYVYDDEDEIDVEII